jgi:hypothetical protein
MGFTLGELWALKVEGPELTSPCVSGINAGPAKSIWEPGWRGPKHMAAGLENTALMASWGDAMPTPPMALVIGIVMSYKLQNRYTSTIPGYGILVKNKIPLFANNFTATDLTTLYGRRCMRA